MENYTIPIALAVLALPAVYAVLSRDKNNGKKLPPGPTGLPILGNLHQLGDFPHLRFLEWTKIYGDVFSIRMGSQLAVIINGPKPLKDLLVTNGVKHSSRFFSYVLNEIATNGDKSFATRKNDEYWRLHRRVSAMALSPKACNGYQPLIDSEAKHLVRDLIGTPAAKNPAYPFQRFSLSTIMNVSFGIGVMDTSNQFFRDAARGIELFFDVAQPARNLADYLPFLRVLPNAQIKKGYECRDLLERVFGDLLKDLKQRIANGTAVDCMIGRVVKDEEGKTIEDPDLIWLAMTVVAAGIETTATTLTWLWCVLANHPEVQQKLHEEMDRVIGRDRIPTADDQAKLPYLNAVIMETNRYRPSGYLGVPHFSTADDEYEGYFIPKGTIMITSQACINNHPSCFPPETEPHKFKPERFLDPSSPAQNWNWGAMFGAGRRACVGMHLAHREMFMAVAHVVWGTKWRLREGVMGLDDVWMTTGLTNNPAPYELLFEERFEGAKKFYQ
ncbi:hypothetical protein HK104_004566 [Borealophlyctis nickersoniae]|nr:hypothetical protein HK104_004566 [Borealophlyctis nickersoniae]